MENECEETNVGMADDFGGELPKHQETLGMEPGRGKPNVEPETHVAFFAGRSLDFGPVNRDSDLVFDKVVTNVGSAFDRVSGRFKAPVRATYQFSVTITGQGGYKAAVNVMKNEVRVLTVGSETNGTWATSTSVPILTLNADDEVWVQVRKDASYVLGDMKTTFSGFLLFRN